MLHGRESEVAAIDKLIDDLRGGTSGALVLHGEPGIGKTSLIEYAASRIPFTLRATGTESEARLPYAGLHLLLRPALDRIDALPEVQATALRGVLGLGPSFETPDRFLIGLAVLSLLAELAEDGPLLVIVDDAHRLDRSSAEALLFATRRLAAEPVAVLLATTPGLPTPGPLPAPIATAPPAAFPTAPLTPSATAPAAAFPATPLTPSAAALPAVSAAVPFASDMRFWAFDFGLPTLMLGGLDPAAAAALLDERAPGLDAATRGRVLAEADGNPLALIELPAMGAPAGGRLPDRLREAFQAQLRPLPHGVRTVLTVVAALGGGGDTGVVLRAAGTLAATPSDLDTAVGLGLIDDSLTFRHSLLRAAVWDGTPPGRRLTIHAALAAALDSPADADRRAWHLAAAATGSDERVAAELERTAAWAGERSGHNAAAAAYERAAELSGDAHARLRRLTLAAEAAGEAGDLERSDTLAARAELLIAHAPAPATTGPDAAAAAAPTGAGAGVTAAGTGAGAGIAAAAAGTGIGAGIAGTGPGTGVGVASSGAGVGVAVTGAGLSAVAIGDAALEARLTGVRAAADFWRGAPTAAHARLLRGAARIAAADRHLALSMLIESLHSGWYTGERELSASIEQLRTALQPEDPLDPLARLLIHAAAPIVGSSFDDPRGVDWSAPGALADAAAANDSGVAVLIAGIGLILGQDAVTVELAAEQVELARRQGRAGWLPQALFYLACGWVFAGRHAEAAVAAAEGAAIAGDTDQDQWVQRLGEPLAYLAAVAGDEQRCRQITDRGLAASPGDPAWQVPWVHAALGLLELGAGRAEAALTWLTPLDAGRARFHISATRSTPDLVEAAVRAGRPDTAREAFGHYRRWAAHARQPWIDAIVARCEALLGPDAEAGPAYERALAGHRAAGRAFDEARTALLYGEWLRRAKRRTEARARLAAALDVFERAGAAPWAERARTELAATGGPAPAPRTGPAAGLTPQELQIARLAARGMANKDIAARLFLSARTVGYHLYKAYPKLGVASRAELSGLDLGG